MNNLKLLKTIANYNKYFTSSSKKRKMIIDSVYSSVKVEGSKTTKKELIKYYNAHCNLVNK